MGNGLGNLVACCDIRSIICSRRYVDTLGTVSDCNVYHSQQWVVLMSCEQKWASRSFIRHCSICLPSVSSWHHCAWRDFSGLLPHTYLHTVSFPDKRGSVGLNSITCKRVVVYCVENVILAFYSWYCSDNLNRCTVWCVMAWKIKLIYWESQKWDTSKFYSFKFTTPKCYSIAVTSWI